VRAGNLGGRPESRVWTGAFYAGRRLLRRGKYMVGHDPLFLPILLRLTPMGVARRIGPDTDLVVEGFPRAGNTFVVYALQSASDNRLNVASHVHHPSQVKLAVAQGIPTVFVVREPIATLSSYLTYAQHGRSSGVLKEYISYHQELVPYADRLLICDFEESTVKMSSVIARINQRYSMKIPPFDQSAANVERIFAKIARQHGILHPKLDPDRVAPRPTTARRELSEHYRAELLSPQNSSLREQALSVYGYFTRKASEQKASWQSAAGAVGPYPPGSAEAARRD
jgi:hypothetical protein